MRNFKIRVVKPNLENVPLGEYEVLHVSNKGYDHKMNVHDTYFLIYIEKDKTFATLNAHRGGVELVKE